MPQHPDSGMLLVELSEPREDETLLVWNNRTHPSLDEIAHVPTTNGGCLDVFSDPRGPLLAVVTRQCGIAIATDELTEIVLPTLRIHIAEGLDVDVGPRLEHARIRSSAANSYGYTVEDSALHAVVAGDYVVELGRTVDEFPAQPWSTVALSLVAEESASVIVPDSDPRATVRVHPPASRDLPDSGCRLPTELEVASVEIAFP